MLLISNDWGDLIRIVNDLLLALQRLLIIITLIIYYSWIVVVMRSSRVRCLLLLPAVLWVLIIVNSLYSSPFYVRTSVFITDACVRSSFWSDATNMRWAASPINVSSSIIVLRLEEIVRLIKILWFDKWTLCLLILWSLGLKLLLILLSFSTHIFIKTLFIYNIIPWFN